MTKGVIWYPVAETVRYEFAGGMLPGTSGRDVLVYIALSFGAPDTIFPHPTAVGSRQAARPQATPRVCPCQ